MKILSSFTHAVVNLYAFLSSAEDISKSIEQNLNFWVNYPLKMSE